MSKVIPGKLPKVLKWEPLIEAIFEIRFKGRVALADILAGFLFHELTPRPKITRLPAAEIPQPMRATDPALQFAPTQRLEWDQYVIGVGDRNIVINCKLPYPKWPRFKSAILEIVGRIAKLEIDEPVERYSVKYVNLIKASTLKEQAAKIKMSIRLGDDQINGDQMALQVHRTQDDLIHILSVIIGAQINHLDGTLATGAIVDVDSICMVDTSSFTEFVSTLTQGIEKLRHENKIKFFGCLTDETIEEMGPIYE